MHKYKVLQCFSSSHIVDFEQVILNQDNVLFSAVIFHNSFRIWLKSVKFTPGIMSILLQLFKMRKVGWQQRDSLRNGCKCNSICQVGCSRQITVNLYAVVRYHSFSKLSKCSEKPSYYPLIRTRTKFMIPQWIGLFTITWGFRYFWNSYLTADFTLVFYIYLNLQRRYF